MAIAGFNVKDFGAVGDGVADDTLAIQKAVSQALHVRGDVFIPVGKYRVTATINCIPVWGQDAGPGLGPNGGTLSRSGCNIIGEHNRGTIIYADFDNWQTVNINGQQVCQYYLTNGTLQPIQEKQYNQTDVYLTDKIVFYYAECMNFSDMWIVKKSSTTNPSGIAFSTPYNTQNGWSSFQRLNIEMFDYGIWHRFTLYSSFRDITIQNCRIGIRFARIDNRYPTQNNRNPIALAGWNSGSTGWFHNVVVFENCSIKGDSHPDSNFIISPGVTEIGFWGCPMAATFISCTCENIYRGSQAANNVIAPAGTPATGIYIEDGQNNGDGKGITFEQFYTEVTERPIYCTYTQDININSGYMQGAYNNSSVTSPIIEVNNCNQVNIRGNIISSGAFNNVIKATNYSTAFYDKYTGGYRLAADLNADSTSTIVKRDFQNYSTISQLNTKANSTDIGNVTTLTTVNKTVVGAINEINAQISGLNQLAGKISYDIN